MRMIDSDSKKLLHPGESRWARPWGSRLGILTAALVLFGLPTVAQAGLLTVNLAGVDLRFKGAQTDIVDDGGDPLGVGDPVDAATFKLDNVLVPGGDWMFPDDIRADLLIEDGVANLAPGIPVDLSLLGSSTNRFIWTVDDGTQLQLDFDTLTVQRVVLSPSLPEIFLITGSATVTGTQTLPGGKQFVGPVGVAYVSTDAMFLGNDNGLITTGVLTITGDMGLTLVPEPTSFALASLGLLIIVCGRRRLDA